MTVKMSNTDKMPGLSWSTQAVDTCPGSRGNDGEFVDACKGCYARFGNYNRPNVKNVRLHNQADWKRKNWVSDMVKALEKETFFRWFDSGDAYSLGLALKILEVMIRTPRVKHWFPTRMHKFAKFESTLAMMMDLRNVVVRFSSDSITGEIIPGRNTSTINHPDRITDWDHVCRAYTRSGKCGDCRMCWDKNVPVITYPQHGAAMARLDLKIAA